MTLEALLCDVELTQEEQNTVQLRSQAHSAGSGYVQAEAASKWELNSWKASVHPSAAELQAASTSLCMQSTPHSRVHPECGYFTPPFHCCVLTAEPGWPQGSCILTGAAPHGRRYPLFPRMAQVSTLQDLILQVISSAARQEIVFLIRADLNRRRKINVLNIRHFRLSIFKQITEKSVIILLVQVIKLIETEAVEKKARPFILEVAFTSLIFAAFVAKDNKPSPFITSASLTVLQTSTNSKYMTVSVNMTMSVNVQ